MPLSNLTAVAEAGVGPFSPSRFWPPIDEFGTPKPHLFVGLAIMGTIMYRLFYGNKMAQLKVEVLKRKRVMRIAQATSIIISQHSEFPLTKEDAEKLREDNPKEAKVFQDPNDLTVKDSIYVPMTLDLNSAMADTTQVNGGAVSDTPPEPPEMIRTDSNMPSTFDTPLKGRELVAVKWGRGQEAKVSTTEEVEEVFRKLTDDDYPAVFVLESSKPEAERLFGLAIDKVYQEKSAEQSVYSASEKRRFVIIEQLLKKRAIEELEDAIVRTLQARKMEGAPPVLPKDVKLLAPFQNGEKLKDLVRLVAGGRHSPGIHEFLPGLVPAETMARAKDVLRRIRASQSSSYKLIWQMLRPCFPFWALGCFTHSLLEVVVINLVGSVFAAKVIDLVSEGRIGQRDVMMLATQCLTGWIVLIVFGWFSANLLNGKAERLFAQSVKTMALRSLLGQDFEYFDKHSPGSLNARLNGDADMLTTNLLGRMKQVITESSAILGNAYLVYRMCPFDMFCASVLPLPLITLGQVRLVKLMRKWDRQAHFMREDANTNIGQVLGEIKTVRDFSMEGKESQRYQQQTEFLGQVQESHSAKRDILGWCMHFLHMSGEMLTLVVGARKVATGELKAGDMVLAIAMINGMVGGKLRGMVDRLRELTFTAEPAGRIVELIQTTPTIEPHKADHFIPFEEAGSGKQVFNSLSNAGEVETDDFKIEGSVLPCGAKAIVLSTATGQNITVTDSEFAMWEVIEGQRVPFCKTPDLKTEQKDIKPLKPDQKWRAKQAGNEWAVDEQGYFLPIHVAGSGVLRLVEADMKQLSQFVDGQPTSAFPMKLFFSRKLMPARIKGELEFKNVEFFYPTELRVPALRDVNFKVEGGKQAAIVGKAGCGKSTIFKLIKRLYDPTSGQVLLDGRPLSEYDVQHLRRKIAVVAQENVLFDTTIRENVSYGIYPEPTESEIRQALKQASALDFVEAFPDNIYTLVGGRGLTLSGGQRQRVAIARCMVRRPQILILDEATAALDPVNEKIVQRALDVLVETTKATALLIAHRLTTIKDASKILVVDEGRIVEQGTHEELLAIPITRHEPKKDEKQGVVKTGLYHSQWNSMMGEEGKSSGGDKLSKEEEDGMKKKLASLQAENARLRLELMAERRQHTRFAQVSDLVGSEQEYRAKKVQFLQDLSSFGHSNKSQSAPVNNFDLDTEADGLPQPLHLERARTVL